MVFRTQLAGLLGVRAGMGGRGRDGEGRGSGVRKGNEGEGIWGKIGLIGGFRDIQDVEINRRQGQVEVEGDVGLSRSSCAVSSVGSDRQRATREREIVTWIARMGAVSIEHVRRRWSVGRSVGYGLVARLVDAALIERVATLPGDPTLLRATHHGLRYARLGLAVGKINPGQVDHWLACSDVALWAESEWGADALMSERELRFAERDSRRPIGSALVGELPSGRELLHRPDFLVTENGSSVAIEVELTPKAPRRLEQLVRAWRRARHVERVLYVVPSGPTERAVRRAIQNKRAEERVHLVVFGSVSQP